MAPKWLHVGLTAALVATLSSMGASAQTGTCSTALVSLYPCLNYMTGSVSAPTSSCCSQLASVDQSEPQCLCEVLNGGFSSQGFTVNQAQALALPGACNILTPPLTGCNGNGGTAAGNGGSIGNGGSRGNGGSIGNGGATGFPTTPFAGGGAGAFPEGDYDFADASSVRIPLTLVFSLLLLAVAYACTSPTVL